MILYYDLTLLFDLCVSQIQVSVALTLKPEALKMVKCAGSLKMVNLTINYRKFASCYRLT